VPTGIDRRRLATLEREWGLEQARRDREQETVDYATWANDPEGFIRDVLGDTKIWSASSATDPEVGGTIEMIRSVRDNAQTVVRGANAMGKDHTAAELIAWWVYACKGLAVVTGPTQRQVDEIVFGREIKGIWARAGLPGRVFARALRPNHGVDDVNEDGTFAWGAIGFVSTDHSHLTGHHAPRVMCVVTEGQGVEDMVYEAMFNNATGANDRLLVVGNPTDPGGRFYKETKPGSGWKSIRLRAQDHPNIAREGAVSGDAGWIWGGPSREWLARVRRETKDEGGERSRFWQVFVEAQFPEGATDGLVPKAWVLAAFDRWTNGDRAGGNGRELVIGVDPMRTGGDFCSLAPVTGAVVHPLYHFRPDERNPTLDMVAKCEALATAYGALGPGAGRRATFVVDSALMGGGVIDVMRSRGWDVVDFNGKRRASDADEPARFLDVRAWGYWILREAFRQNVPVIRPDDGLLEDFLATRYETGASDQVKIIDKKEIRKQLGRSPDKADSVMMAWTVAMGGGYSKGGSDPDTDFGL
jgi:hypothetical protein